MGIKEAIKATPLLIPVKRKLDLTAWDLKSIIYTSTHHKKSTKDYTISFCTTCKGRKWQLEQTLKKNIADNSDYEKCNFVLIDYNSKDGLEKWIKSNFQSEIKSSKLIYYKNSTFNNFQMPHAKNISHKLGTGEIIVNLDADNFTGKDFAAYINNQFKATENIMLISGSGYGTTGRTVVLKEHFLGVNGYDEKFKVYGWEEIDFINRIKLKYNTFPMRIPKIYLSDIKNYVKNDENKKFKDKMTRDRIDTNEQIYLNNKKNKIIIVNDSGYGQGTFIKNFSKKVTIK